MSKNTKNPHTIQLSFLDLDFIPQSSDPEKPHPLIVAERWNFRLDYVEVDGDPKHYLYHVQQWVQGLGATDHTTWVKMKNELVNSTHKLPLEELPIVASNGKTYFVEYTDQAGCYAIAQAMRTTKKRPQLAEIKEYLIKAGVFVDNLRRGDKETVEWVKSRLEGVQVRKSSTQIYTETHITHHPNIAYLTNVTYHELFQTRKQETAKKEIVKQLGLTPSQAANLRDHLHTLALDAIKAAETLAGEKMRSLGRTLDDDEQLAIVRYASQMEAESYAKKCQWLDVDPVTGLKSKHNQYDWEM